MNYYSTRSLPLVAMFAAFGIASTSASAATIFVNAATALPTGSQTGATWALAYKDLQTAIAQSTNGDDIWVAKGTYKPTAIPNRALSFALKNGVRMLGGFLVGAPTLADRDPLANPTILSGDIGAAGNSDNSFHVVRAINVTNATVLSGFVITGGNANSGADTFGGGLDNAGGSPRIVDCVFVNNNASVSGGGIANIGLNGGIPVEISNCIFEGNSAGVIGGAADVQTSGVSFFFCAVVNNTGGGIRYLNAGTASQISNSIVRGNTGSGSIVAQQVSVTTSTVSIVFDDISGGAALGAHCIDADPHFVDADGIDNVVGNLDDNLRLRGDSPCIDQASTGNFPADAADLDGDGVIQEGLPLDLGGTTRRIEDTLIANPGGTTAPVPDMGAFEYPRPRTVLVNLAATGANNGKNWTDAYTSLQSAITELNAPRTGGPGEIWVAKGTYKPTPSTNQLIDFVPPVHVQMFGGFAGGELARSARNWIANPTILSGEIGAATATDNTDIVVHYAGIVYQNDSVLDGFVVTRGNGGAAGGIVADNNASPTIRNCRIIDNAGGILLSGEGSANPKLDNSIIAGNTIFGVSMTLTDCSVTNCTVAHNTGTASSGAGILIQSSTADIRNCLAFGNVSNGEIDQNAQIGFPNTDSLVSPLISCCAIQGFGFGYPADVGCFAIGADGGCIDPAGADGIFGTLDDDYSPLPCSDVVDAGDNAVNYPDTLDYDEDGDVLEALNTDFALALRRIDLPVPNSGIGVGAIDVGAFERQVAALPDADYDNDGDVDGADLAVLLGAWATTNAAIDLNGDCNIDGADLAILLGAWT